MKIKPIAAVLLAALLLESADSFAIDTKISGSIKNNKSKEVSVSLFSNVIEVFLSEHKCKVGRNGSFNMVIDLDKPAYGFINIGGDVHAVFTIPGKAMIMNIDRKKISYVGPCANDNTFLSQIKADDNWTYTNYNLDLSPDVNFAAMVKKHDGYLAQLSKSNASHRLSNEFIAFFKAEDLCRFNRFLINFPGEYVQKHQLTITDQVFAANFAYPISYFCSDGHVNCPSYLPNIQQRIIGIERLYLQQQKKISFNEARNLILTEGLSGKTRDYAIANSIFLATTVTGNLDLPLVQKFRSTATDPIAIASVIRATDRYSFDNSFKNKPLAGGLKNTVLIGADGAEITLAGLLAGTRVKFCIWIYGRTTAGRAVPKRLMRSN